MTHPRVAAPPENGPLPAPRARTKVALPEIVRVCEALYARDGFVQWTDVGEAVGLTRQATYQRIKQAVERGEIPEADFTRWQSLSTRRAISRERSKQTLVNKREKEKRTFQIEFTPENYAWLREQAVLKGVSTADLVNGLVAKCRG